MRACEGQQKGEKREHSFSDIVNYFPDTSVCVCVCVCCSENWESVFLSLFLSLSVCVCVCVHTLFLYQGLAFINDYPI